MFTVKYDGFPLSLIFDVSVETVSERINIKALLDTGSTNTFISDRIAKILGLKQIGEFPHLGSSGYQNSDTYVASIVLPDKTYISDVTLVGIDTIPNNDLLPVDVIIGMDIIQTGDIHIIHKNNKTILIYKDF